MAHRPYVARVSITDRITAALGALRKAREDDDLSAEFVTEVLLNNLIGRYADGER